MERPTLTSLPLFLFFHGYASSYSFKVLDRDILDSEVRNLGRPAALDLAGQTRMDSVYDETEMGDL